MNEHKVEKPTDINQFKVVQKKSKADEPSKLKTRKVAAVLGGLSWLDEPETFDRNEYIAEMAQLLKDIYGSDLRQHRWALRALADQMQVYLDCKIGIAELGVVASFNNGKTLGSSPYVSTQREALSKIVQLMNDMGLMPKQIYEKTSSGINEADDFLAGPKVSAK